MVRDLRIFFFSSLSYAIGMLIVNPLLPLFLQDTGANAAEISLVLTSSGLISTILIIVSPVLVQRYGSKKILASHLQAYVNAIIFNNAALNIEFPTVSNSLSAINFGIQRELESILYYQEMKNFVPEAQRYILDTIINEEGEHFTKLSDLKAHMQTLTE